MLYLNYCLIDESYWVAKFKEGGKEKRFSSQWRFYYLLMSSLLSLRYFVSSQIIIISIIFIISLCQIRMFD